MFISCNSLYELVGLFKNICDRYRSIALFFNITLKNTLELMISKNKILYPIGLSFLLLLIYNFFSFLRLENFTMFIIVVFFMLFNQLLSFLFLDTSPKEGLDKVSSIFCLLATTQFFSILLLGVYLSIVSNQVKNYFQLDIIIFSLLFFVITLPTIMTFLIWNFHVRLQKPKF